MSIPKRALVHEAGESFVFRAVADTVERVHVVTGYEDSDHIEVLEGLAVGDRIVRVGQGALKEGSRFVEVGADQDDDATAAVEESADTAMVQR